VEKACIFSIEKGIAVDRDIHDMLVYMASETVTSTVLNQELTSSKEYLSGARYLSIVSGNKIFFENRMELVAE
jgi:hypothetical protein